MTPEQIDALIAALTKLAEAMERISFEYKYH